MALRVNQHEESHLKQNAMLTIRVTRVIIVTINGNHKIAYSLLVPPPYNIDGLANQPPIVVCSNRVGVVVRYRLGASEIDQL